MFSWLVDDGVLSWLRDTESVTVCERVPFMDLLDPQISIFSCGLTD